MANSEIIINPIYQTANEYQGRYLNLYGSRGSGKSVFAGQKLILRCLTETPHKFLLARKVHRSIKGSQLELLKKYIYLYKFESKFEFLENEIKCKNGNRFVSAGLDDPEKLKSIENITSYWIEEPTELSEQDFLNVDAVLRGETKNYKQGILTYNPIDHLHWLNHIQLHNALTLKTTYKDNLFIDKEYIEMLESLKEINPELYKVWTLGEWGVKLDLVYPLGFKILDIYPTIFDETIYGLDFGYNNQSALIKIDIKDKCNYLTELLYESKLTNTDLIKRLDTLITNKNNIIYADCAEPARIEELKRAKFNIKPADKSVKDGIDYCKSQIIYSNYDNKNLNEEVHTYCWKQDRNGDLLDEPVKFNDHMMDAMRYAIYTHSKNNGEVHIFMI
jgi:phage terminase large subunit